MRMPTVSPRACGMVLVALLAASGAPAQESPEGAGPAAAEAAGPAFTLRVREALERTRGAKVVYQDVLGEGPGAWDQDPRYPGDQVNCLTWLHLLLAKAYGQSSREKLQVMDRLRYFNGQPGFGLRKHFIDQWTALDPLPLRKVDFGFCRSSAVQPYHLDLTPAVFAKNVGYSCPLYGAKQTSVDLDLVPAHGLVQCAGMLPEGFYVIFPVASERYLQRYGKLSGPMGQVHAVLLAAEGEPGVKPEDRDAAQLKVYHASISSGKVMEAELGSYLLNMWNLYRGYVVYELVPDWNWKEKPALDDEARAIAACEAGLEGNVGRLFEDEVVSPRP